MPEASERPCVDLMSDIEALAEAAQRLHLHDVAQLLTIAARMVAQAVWEAKSCSPPPMV